MLVTLQAAGLECFSMPLTPQSEEISWNDEEPKQLECERGPVRRHATSLQRLSDRRSHQQLKVRLRSLGWATLILEDFLQLTLQVLLGLYKGFDLALLQSLCVSVVAFVFAVLVVRIIMPQIETKDLEHHDESQHLELDQVDAEPRREDESVDLPASSSVQSGE
jgi:hypothetical protein